jgi:hypothetical protein
VSVCCVELPPDLRECRTEYLFQRDHVPSHGAQMAIRIAKSAVVLILISMVAVGMFIVRQILTRCCCRRRQSTQTPISTSSTSSDAKSNASGSKKGRRSKKAD